MECPIQSSKLCSANTFQSVSNIFINLLIILITDGQCKYGEKCSFKHGDDDNQTEGDQESNGMGQMPMPNMPMDMNNNMN